MRIMTKVFFDVSFDLYVTSITGIKMRWPPITLHLFVLLGMECTHRHLTQTPLAAVARTVQSRRFSTSSEDANQVIVWDSLTSPCADLPVVYLSRRSVILDCDPAAHMVFVSAFHAEEVSSCPSVP